VSCERNAYFTPFVSESAKRQMFVKQALRGGRSMALTILNLGDLKEWGGQRHAPATLTPGKEPSFHSRGG